MEQSFERMLECLNDEDAEILWDDVEQGIDDRSEFSAADIRAAQDILGKLTPGSEAADAALKVLARVDATGGLLEHGVAVVLRSELRSRLKVACRFADSMPEKASAELCDALQQVPHAEVRGLYIGAERRSYMKLVARCSGRQVNA